MDAKHQFHILKCPKCLRNIKISEGRFCGGINDNGGWILECSYCSTKFPVEVKNPNDASDVLSGATIVDSWDDETENKQFVFEKHGVSDCRSQDLKRLLVVDVGDKDKLQFNITGRPIYLCNSCKSPIEAIAYSALSTNFSSVNSEIEHFLLSLSFGRETLPDVIFINQRFMCSCGQRITAKFYLPFDERELPTQEHSEFLLIGAENTLIDVDGVYTRDDCLAILEKLLIRWNCVHNLVMLVVPFIGFHFKNSETKRFALWNRLLKHTIPDKTAIITRRATFTSFNEAAANQGMNLAFLKDYDLLNPTLTKLSERNALFKTNSHAKFYCGLSGDSVEVLHGSFNIHEGGYVENIQFKEYTLAEFLRRYMANFNVPINPTLLVQKKDALVIMSTESGAVSRRMVTCNASFAELL